MKGSEPTWLIVLRVAGAATLLLVGLELMSSVETAVGYMIATSQLFLAGAVMTYRRTSTSGPRHRFSIICVASGLFLWVGGSLFDTLLDGL